MLEKSFTAEIAVLGTPYGENAEKRAKSTDFSHEDTKARSFFCTEIEVY